VIDLGEGHSIPDDIEIDKEDITSQFKSTSDTEYVIHKETKAKLVFPRGVHFEENSKLRETYMKKERKKKGRNMQE